MKSTLEFHAWRLIVQQLSGGSKGECDPEFNCFCYMQKYPEVEKSLGNKASCLNGMYHYLSEGKKRGWDGSCCVKGQKKAKPKRKGEVLYGECKNFKYNGGSITAKGMQYKKQSISMRYGFKDKGRGDITPHCTGIFKCDGDLLWCPAKACPMTEADRARQGKPSYQG